MLTDKHEHIYINTEIEKENGEKQINTPTDRAKVMKHQAAYASYLYLGVYVSVYMHVYIMCIHLLCIMWF